MIKRLVVILPDSFSSYQVFTQKIHQMALVDEREILYFAIYAEDKKLEMERWLTTLEAITRSPQVKVQSTLIKNDIWVEKFMTELRPNDVIICPDGFRQKTGYFQSAPLQQYLSSQVSQNVRVVPGTYRTISNQFVPWLRIAVFWIGFLVILLGFGILEINVDNMIQGFTRPLLLLILLVMEIGAIYTWNAVVG